MSILWLPLFLAACSGEAPAPVAAPVAPPAAPPTPPPVAAPPAAEAVPVTGPYTPDDLAKAAYDTAKAAGADALKNAKEGDALAIAAGKALYDTRCATCHGATGAGDGIAGSALPQKPANFHHKERWDASSIGVKHWVLMNGIKGTGMVPLGLTADQAWDVLAYVHSDFTSK